MRTGYLRTAYLKLLTKTKTMKATELRIGNYVYLEATRENEIVKAIDYTVDERCVIKTKGGDSEYLTGVEPIPLTEEWLINLGFEKWTWCDDCAFIPLFFGDSLYCRYYNNQWNIKRMKVGRDSKGVYGKSEGKYVLPKGIIKHVHQLQNLYFALTGKELTKL